MAAAPATGAIVRASPSSINAESVVSGSSGLPQPSNAPTQATPSNAANCRKLVRMGSLLGRTLAVVPAVAPAVGTRRLFSRENDIASFGANAIQNSAPAQRRNSVHLFVVFIVNGSRR